MPCQTQNFQITAKTIWHGIYTVLGNVYFMKYEKEIDQFLRDIIYEDWMNEEDYNEVINETFKLLGTNKEKLNDDIEIGIKNGYSIETQFALVKRILNVA